MADDLSKQPERALYKEIALAIGNSFNSKPYLKGVLALVATLLTLWLGVVPSDDRHWPWLITSAAVVIIASIPPICEGYWESESAKGDDNIAIRGRVLSGYIASTLTHLAVSVDKSKQDRRKTADFLVDRITRDIVNGYPDTEGVRCAIYELSNDKQSMKSVSHYGRKDEPRTFYRAQPRGKAAIEWLLSRDDTPKFVRDTRIEDPGEREGANEFYTTYISIPVKTSNKTYGMLTIDAQQGGDLDENDSHLLAVYASIVALAMAEGERGGQSRKGREAR